MKTYTPAHLHRGVLGAAADLYTVPAGAEVIVKQAVIVNRSTTTSSDVVLQLVDDGESPGDEHVVLDTTLEPGETVFADYSQVITEGATVRGSASEDVVLRLSGVLITEEN